MIRSDLLAAGAGAVAVGAIFLVAGEYLDIVAEEVRRLVNVRRKCKD